MNEQKHTPEPWPEPIQYLSGTKTIPLRTWKRFDNDKYPFGSLSINATLHNISGAPEGIENEAMACLSRIVACVNACAGMADPAAEIEQLRAENAELKKAQGEPVHVPDRDVIEALRVGLECAQELIKLPGHKPAYANALRDDEKALSKAVEKYGRYQFMVAPQPAAAIDERKERAKFERVTNAARFFPRELSFAQTKSPSGRDEYENPHIQSRWEGRQDRAKLNAQPAFADIEGTYYCQCVSCSKEFVSNNKRATTCLACLQPAPSRCSLCDCTGDVHRADGEWLGTCPYCKPAPAVPEPKK